MLRSACTSHKAVVKIESLF